MRLGLPRALITSHHFTLLLLLLLLPSVVRPAAQFGSLQARETAGTSRDGSPHSLQSWFSVVTAATTTVCSLSFTTDLVTILTSQVDCQLFAGPDNSATNHSTISTQSWTFYHTIGSSLYQADSLLTLEVANSGSSTILQLSVCLSPACGAGGPGGPGGDTICLTSPHSHHYPISSASQHSSSPEGFVFAIAGPSSSSEHPATMATTTTIATMATTSRGPQVEPVVVEQSSASVMSFVSSTPEGFVMAFKEEEESSSVSAFSSTAEGFIFAFGNNNPSSLPASY